MFFFIGDWKIEILYIFVGQLYWAESHLLSQYQHWIYSSKKTLKTQGFVGQRFWWVCLSFSPLKTVKLFWQVCHWAHKGKVDLKASPGYPVTPCWTPTHTPVPEVINSTFGTHYQTYWGLPLTYQCSLDCKPHHFYSTTHFHNLVLFSFNACDARNKMQAKHFAWAETWLQGWNWPSFSQKNRVLKRRSSDRHWEDN